MEVEVEVSTCEVLLLDVRRHRERTEGQRELRERKKEREKERQKEGMERVQS